MISRLIITILIGNIIIFPCWNADAIDDAPDELLEYKIKTAFLFNFAKFVDWPPNSFGDNSDQFKIGILSAPKLVTTAKMLANKSIKGGHVDVVFFDSLDELIPCHMLFIGTDDKEQLGTIIQKFKHIPVLTVADTAGFADQGGVINFIKVNNTIRFEINAKVAEEKKLKISSRLLSLARIVTSPQSKGTNK
ncbi:MAG: YfiR family protein [Desulfobacteraceae bacterium]|jgi:hypothetical protein